MFLKNRRVLAVAILALVLAAVGFVGNLPISDVSAGDDRYEKIKVFTEALSVVERSYVKETDTKDLIYSAIKGMVSDLDPHSAFMTPEDYKEMQVSTKGEFGGIGIQISMKEGVLTIIAPIEDTPGWRAGLKAGDQIIKIDGEPTKGITIHEAVSRMRGPKGEEVTISIRREGVEGLTDYTIVRDIIKLKSVKSKVLEDDIGYVRIIQFQQRTASDLSKALVKLRKESDVAALVLDLRNNPGGLLNSAVDVAGRFLPQGKLVVYIKGRDGSRTEYRTRGPGKPFDLPMVVLVNQGSASASEIVAGALKDWKRAVVLGVKTFGKGSVQTVVPLSDGSGLRLTTAIYYTPKGTEIQSEVIVPDIEVELKAVEGQVAHTVIREKDLEGHLENNKVEGEPGDKKPGDKKKEEEKEKAVLRPLSEEEDTQLQRAIDLLKTWSIFKELSAETGAPEHVPANP